MKLITIIMFCGHVWENKKKTLHAVSSLGLSTCGNPSVPLSARERFNFYGFRRKLQIRSPRFGLRLWKAVHQNCSLRSPLFMVWSVCANWWNPISNKRHLFATFASDVSFVTQTFQPHDFFQLLQNVCYYFVVFAVVVGLAVGSFECSRFRVTTHLYVSVNKNRLLEATFVCVVFQAQTCAKSFLIFSTKWRVWKISGGSISALRRLFLLRKGNCSYGLNFIYLAC